MKPKPVRMRLRIDLGTGWYILTRGQSFYEQFCVDEFERMFPWIKLKPGESRTVDVEINFAKEEKKK